MFPKSIRRASCPQYSYPQQICSRPFGEDEQSIVRKIIRDGQCEAIHRSAIARRVCIALDWRNARGDLKEMGARVALLRLHRQGWIMLPANAQRQRQRRRQSESAGPSKGPGAAGIGSVLPACGIGLDPTA
jgi:hypothetical protein